MGKSILVLTGSSRRGGNSDKMADAFIAGAVEAGHAAVKFEATSAEIKGCRACGACFSKGRPCVFEDDFNEGLAPLLEKADALVFATPLYWFSFPAQLKAAMDKLYAFLVGKRPLKIRECALLVCGVAHDLREYEGIVRSYETIAEYER